MRSPLRRVLAPLCPLYRLGLDVREWRLSSGREPTRRLRFPVVSVGNLSTGGSGKTPLTIVLAQLLSTRGLKVDVLSRGYGRGSKHSARVRVDGTALEFGDEPLLIARAAGVPVYVAPQRYDAGLLAEQELGGMPGTAPGQQVVHILDDGFQHRQLDREVNLLLVSRQDWRDRLLPAGNLREPLRAAARADVLVISADEPDFEAELRAWGWKGPVWQVRRYMEVPAIAGPAIAFCGIARPEQFFDGLEAAGLSLAGRIAFPDHHRYTERDLRRLTADLRAAGAAACVTTEKDRVRLEPRDAALPLLTARLRLELEDEMAAVEWVLSRLEESRLPNGARSLKANSI